MIEAGTETRTRAEQIVHEALAAGVRPDPEMAVSEWADRYRILSMRYAAEPGPYRTSRTPYLKEVMDALSPSSPYERVVLMAGAQIGKTEAGNNWIGHVMHMAPGPMMMVMPTIELAKRNSKQRIDPMIEGSPVLRKLVRERRSRDSGNTVLSKEFTNGGILVMTGAESAVGLRSMPVRYLFLDEVDAYPGDVEGEGDPVSLAMARTRTFARKKIFMTSTPKIKGLSRIEAVFEESDKRYPWVPCPFCNEFQTLKWTQLRWPKGEPEKTWYECEHCKGRIENHHKHWMLPRCELRPSGTGDRKTFGAHISSLYAPVGWEPTFADVAKMAEASREDSSILQTFVNGVLAETWRNTQSPPDWRRLYDRREPYPLRSVPAGGLFLTAGVDVHPDRIEAQIVAWGRRKESWLVDYVVLDGKTQDPGAEAWVALCDLLHTSYRHESRTDLPIMIMAVDEGDQTQVVREWVRRQPAGRVLDVKGEPFGEPISLPKHVDLNWRGKKIPRGLKMYKVGTGMLKEELYGYLNLDPPTAESSEPFPGGYCHFPHLPEEFFKQLTSEVLEIGGVKAVRGKAGAMKRRRRPEWVPTRTRNEALDTRIYARAAASQFGMDRFSESRWREFESTLGVSRVPSGTQQAAQKPGTAPQLSRDSFRPILPEDPYL